MKLLPNTKVRIKTRVEIVPEESVLSGNFYYDGGYWLLEMDKYQGSIGVVDQPEDEDDWYHLKGIPYTWHIDWLEVIEDHPSESQNSSSEDDQDKDEPTPRVVGRPLREPSRALDRPPLGVSPQYIHDYLVNKNRVLEILRSLQDYIQVDKAPNKEWLREFHERMEEMFEDNSSIAQLMEGFKDSLNDKYLAWLEEQEEEDEQEEDLH